MKKMKFTAGSLYKSWRPVTVEEMKGFVAVILNMGIVQLGNLKDYWCTSDTTDLPFFQSVFSRTGSSKYSEHYMWVTWRAH